MNQMMYLVQSAVLYWKMILNSVQIVALRLNENEVKSFVEYEINMSYAYGEKKWIIIK